MRSEKEIEEALPPETEPSRWPGMTYEQGVDNALRWVLGWTDESPMED